MDKDFMLHYFNKAVQPEWEELLKTPRYQPAASKRDAIAREFFRMLNDEQYHAQRVNSTSRMTNGMH